MYQLTDCETLYKSTHVHVFITVAQIHKPHCTYAWNTCIHVCTVYNKQSSSGSNIIF